MNWLRFIIFGIILVSYQTLMSNAVVCYGCAPGDDVPTHMREFIINSTQGFYPAKCNADEIDTWDDFAPITCKKSCGVVKLTRMDEKGMLWNKERTSFSS